MSNALESMAIRAVSPPCLLGESPFWHTTEACLYWCDIAAKRVYRLNDATGAIDHWDLPSEPACCAPLLRGGLVLAMRDGIWRLDTDSGARTLLAAPPYDPAHERFNDGKCDPQGRFWAGTIYEPRDRPAAALYRLDRHGLTRCAGQVTTANGLAWSVDAATVYWADTRAHLIHAMDFDIAAGSLSNQREWRRFALRGAGQSLASYEGRPDGAAVDSEGCYWVAMYEGAQVQRLSPQGETLEVLHLPVRCPTMPCFGGVDLRTLYITSARQHRPAEELADEPLAGCVLALDVAVAGLPVNFCYL
jgi:sugar lactone lactonase YvrE